MFRLTRGDYLMRASTRLAAPLAIAALAAAPAAAAEPAVPELARCEAPIGSVALVEGDQAGWSGWGLGSPRDLIVALAEESNCFTVDNPADTVPAQFLVTLIAGNKEEVDQGIAVRPDRCSAGCRGAARCWGCSAGSAARRRPWPPLSRWSAPATA
jgi:hypothetical protein